MKDVICGTSFLLHELKIWGLHDFVNIIERAGALKSGSAEILRREVDNLPYGIPLVFSPVTNAANPNIFFTRMKNI